MECFRVLYALAACNASRAIPLPLPLPPLLARLQCTKDATTHLAFHPTTDTLIVACAGAALPGRRLLHGYPPVCLPLSVCQHGMASRVRAVPSTPPPSSGRPFALQTRRETCPCGT